MTSYMVNNAGKRVCHRGHIMTKALIYKEKRKDGGISEHCKVCRQENQAAFNAKKPDYFKQYNKRWKKDNKVYRVAYESKKRLQYRKQWISFFTKKYGKTPQCQLCEKRLYWTHARHDFRVCFDHRTGNELIKSKSPRTWIQNKPCIESNVRIFELCNFGILCRACNILMSSDIGRRKAIAWNLAKYLEESGL